MKHTQVFQKRFFYLSIERKADLLQKANESKEQMIFFDPDIMANIPWIFSWASPYVDFFRNLLLDFTDYTGLPFWVGIFQFAFVTRASLIPQIAIQIRKISEIGKTIPVISNVKRAAELSELSKFKQNWKTFRAFQYLSKNIKLRPFLLVAFNLIHIPILVTNIWVLRTSLAEDVQRQNAFLWIPSYIHCDPYAVFPFMICAIYYYNFGRFITDENRHTLISRLRQYCQIFSILWFPVLCYFPSAISFYIFLNALFTLGQTTMTSRIWFIKRVNPKQVMSQIMLKQNQFENNQAETLIDSIRKGEESYLHNEIDEDRLVEKVSEILDSMNTIQTEDSLRSDYKQFFGVK